MAHRKPCGVLLAAVLVGGCTMSRTTDPQRSASEQLLMSTAADRALEQMGLAALAGKKVFVDPTCCEGYDKGYLVGALADHISRQGGHLVLEKKDAEVVAALRSGALSVDRSETLIGIPSIPLPIPFAHQVWTPELAIFKIARQTGLAKLALTAHEAQSGAAVASIGPVYGKSRLNRWTILALPFLSTDIPAKQSKYRWLPWND